MEIKNSAGSALFDYKTTEGSYHFVVRAPDHTHDDPHGSHFPNHFTVREYGHRIVRELKEGGYYPGDAALLIHDEMGTIIHTISF